MGTTVRIDWLDGLRAYAILGVFFVHASWLFPDSLLLLARCGQYGVQLFFVVSALTACITLDKSLSRFQPVWAWWIRRLCRIAPAYYIGIIAYAISGIIRYELGRGYLPVEDWLSAAVANVFFIHAFVPSANNNIVPGGWSIGVEMFFYLIAPVLFLIARLKVIGAGLLLIASITLALCSPIYFGGPIANNSYEYFSPLTQLPVILLGLTLWNLTQRWLFSNHGSSVAINAAASILLALGVPLGLYSGVVGEKAHHLAPAFTATGFIGLTILARGPLRVAFENRYVRTLGRVSFSFYLIHFAVLDAFRLLFHVGKFDRTYGGPIILAVSFGISFYLANLSWRYIEKPSTQIGLILTERLLRGGAST